MKDFELVLNGGLGNQLFGWAAAVGISQISGLSFQINASNTRERGYQLSAYGIEATFNRPSNLSTRFKFPTQRIKRLTTVIGISPNFNFSEQGFRFDARFFENPKGKTLFGYFQSPLYFEHAKKEITDVLHRVDFQKNSYLELFRILQSEEFITVHIRRGDYIGLENYHGLVDAKYFASAREQVLQNNSSYRFVVFSDSIELAKFVFPYGDLYIGEDVDLLPPEILSLMSSTKGIIGSNSSLSWWAGYLNQSTSPIRIYPTPWFSNRQLDTTDLVPADWNRLPSGF